MIVNLLLSLLLLIGEMNDGSTCGFIMILLRVKLEFHLVLQFCKVMDLLFILDVLRLPEIITFDFKGFH